MKRKLIKRILPKKKPQLKEGIISDLAACRAAFASVKIPWVITEGIILGYARQKDVLAWDTDLDLGIFREISAKEWQQLYTALRSAGFGIKNLKQDFVYGRRRVKFNLWLFHKKGRFYESFPRTTPGLKFVVKAMWFDEPQQVKFLGSKYPMPNHLKNYLDLCYGSDWKTRIVKDHKAWFNEKRRRCQKGGDLWPQILKVKETP